MHMVIMPYGYKLFKIVVFALYETYLQIQKNHLKTQS